MKSLLVLSLAHFSVVLWPSLPKVEFFYLLLGMGLVCLGYWLLGSCLGFERFKLQSAWLVGLLLIGVASTGVRHTIYINQRLEVNLESLPLVLDVFVEESLKKQDNQDSYLVNIISSKTAGGERLRLKGLMKLSWYGQGRPSLQPGERWQVTAKLKRPHSVTNFANGSAELFSYRKRLVAKGYVISSSRWFRLQPASFSSLTYLRSRLRQAVARRLHLLLLTPEQSAFIMAVGFGDHSGVSPTWWQDFRATGTVHLLAISGLHIGAIMLIAYNFVRVRLVAASIATVYGIVSGAAVPVVRTLSCLWLQMWVRSQGVALTSAQCLLLVACLMVLMSPMLVFSQSFYLSFVAVGLIVSQLHGRVLIKKASWSQSIASALALQLILSVGMMPLSVLYFKQVSTSALVINPIVIPLLTFVALPAGIILLVFELLSLDRWFVGLESLFVGLLSTLVDLILSIVHWGGSFSWGSLDVSFSPLKLLVFSLCCLTVALPVGMPGKWLSVIGLVLLMQPQLEKKLEAGQAELTVLDVGQGLAVLVRTRTHVLLYDTGDQWGEGYDAGSAVIVPELNSLGIKELDKVIVSHNDMDHRGGLASVLSAIKVRSLDSSAHLREGHSNRCRAKKSWQWDEVEFTYLHPTDTVAHNENNSSCVLLIKTSGGSALLTGDIEKEVEQTLLQTSAQHFPVDVLLAPHHGSKTSSSWPFLSKTQVKKVIYSVGYLNRYHHPSQVVAQRYHSVGASAYSTSSCGAIRLLLEQTAGKSVSVSCARLSPKRFWRVLGTYE